MPYEIEFYWFIEYYIFSFFTKWSGCSGTRAAALSFVPIGVCVYSLCFVYSLPFVIRYDNSVWIFHSPGPLCLFERYLDGAKLKITNQDPSTSINTLLVTLCCFFLQLRTHPRRIRALPAIRAIIYQKEYSRKLNCRRDNKAEVLYGLFQVFRLFW